jgi:hypothetical protein
MSSFPNAQVKAAAQELARLLAIARQTVAYTPPHYCAGCGTVNPHPSLSDGRRCWRCGITPEREAHDG